MVKQKLSEEGIFPRGFSKVKEAMMREMGGISSESSHGYLYYGVNTYGSDELIEVYSGENLLLSTVSRKSFNSFIVSFEGLNNGDSLTVKIGNDSYECTAGQNSSMGSFGVGKGFKG